MKISSTTKQILIMMFALSLILFGIGSLFTENILSFFIGFLLGTGFSMLKLILLEKTISRAMEMPQEKAINYTRLHYTLRYILTGVVLLIAVFRKEQIDLIAVIIGLIILRPAIYLVALKEKRIKNNN